jgi:hypothetical protein
MANRHSVARPGDDIVRTSVQPIGRIVLVSAHKFVFARSLVILHVPYLPSTVLK